MTYSTIEAVERLGVSPRALQRRVERGTLKATRNARGWLRFDAADVDRLVTERTTR
jgi:excisionase family DNA binding protein